LVDNRTADFRNEGLIDYTSKVINKLFIKVIAYQNYLRICVIKISQKRIIEIDTLTNNKKCDTLNTDNVSPRETALAGQRCTAHSSLL
jgi:hypothetical protein